MAYPPHPARSVTGHFLQARRRFAPAQSGCAAASKRWGLGAVERAETFGKDSKDRVAMFELLLDAIEAPQSTADNADRILRCRDALTAAFKALALEAERAGWSDDETAIALFLIADPVMVACSPYTSFPVVFVVTVLLSLPPTSTDSLKI